MQIKCVAVPKDLQWLANDMMDRQCKASNNWNIVKEHLKHLPESIKHELLETNPHMKEFL